MTVSAADDFSSRTTSQSQRVVDGLTGRIQGGLLKVGDRLPPEPELMREYGVSRSVVREALSRLQAGGLLRTRQGVGSFVLATQPQANSALLQEPGADLNLQQKLDLLELRVGLEADAAALAAQRRTPEQLTAMERALQDFEVRRAAGESTAEADFRFHELVAQATGNEYFVHVLRSLTNATIPRDLARPAAPSEAPPRFGEPSPKLRSRKDITANEHFAVLDAIRRGDVLMARAAMFMHLYSSRDRMRQAGS